VNLFARYFFGPVVLRHVLEAKGRREAYLFACALIVSISGAQVVAHLSEHGVRVTVPRRNSRADGPYCS
jgi:hypothetical protein